MPEKSKGFCAPDFQRKGRPPGITNAETQTRRLEVEALMTQRLSAADIHLAIQPRFPVTLRTVKNDIKGIYQMWSARLRETTKNAEQEHLAALLQIRDRAWNGRPITDDAGEECGRVDRDSRLALDCERDIGKLTGAVGPEPTANVLILIERAETIVQKMIGVVFKVVRDEGDRAFIKDETAKLLRAGDDDGPG